MFVIVNGKLQRCGKSGWGLVNFSDKVHQHKAYPVIQKTCLELWDGVFRKQECPNVSNPLLYHKVNPISRVVLHRWLWVVAPPRLDHLFPMAEGLCCPVCGRTKLRGALRMDEHRTNERLVDRLRFFPPSFLYLFSTPFAAFCQIDDVQGKYYLFCFRCFILSCPPLLLLSQFWWQNWEMKPK